MATAAAILLHPSTLNCKHQSPWIDCCRGDIYRFLLLLAHVPLLFASISSAIGKEHFAFLQIGCQAIRLSHMLFFKYVVLLPLGCLSLRGKSHSAAQWDKVERDEYIFLSPSIFLLFISIDVIGASCLSGNSPSGTLDF